MSHIDKITGELQALVAGTERAQGLTAAANQQAQEVAMRAAGAGFAAVAAGMVRVRDTLATVQGSLGGLAASIGEAMKSLAAVPEGASPQETVAGLQPVRTSVEGIREAAAAAVAQVDSAQQLVTIVLQGGQPGPLLQSLGNIKEVLTLMAQRTSTAREYIETTAAEALQLGSSGN